MCHAIAGMCARQLQRQPDDDGVPWPGRPKRCRWVEKSSSRRSVNYLEREARKRSLDDAGEEFVVNFERARLLHAYLYLAVASFRRSAPSIRAIHVWAKQCV